MTDNDIPPFRLHVRGSLTGREKVEALVKLQDHAIINWALHTATRYPDLKALVFERVWMDLETEPGSLIIKPQDQ